MAGFLQFYLIFEPVRQYLGIFLNCLLIFCIVKKSTSTIARYSFLLINCAICDLLTCLFSLFVQPRVTHYGDGYYYICYGYCKYVGWRSCVWGYAIIVMFYGNLSTAQLASFLYRWYILYYDSPSKKQIIALISFLTIPNIIIFIICSIPLILANMAQDHREIALMLHPEEVNSSIATFGIPLAITDFRGSIPTYWMLVSPFPITPFVFFIRWRILSFLKNQNVVSEQRQKMHRALLRALSVQAILPVVYFVNGLSNLTHNFYLAAYLDVAVNELKLYFFCGFIPVLAPICSLYFVAPYRTFVGGLVGVKSQETTPIVVSSSQ